MRCLSAAAFVFANGSRFGAEPVDVLAAAILQCVPAVRAHAASTANAARQVRAGQPNGVILRLVGAPDLA